MITTLLLVAICINLKSQSFYSFFYVLTMLLTILKGEVMTKNNVNPAIMGLSCFSLTTLMMQFYNLGMCSIGPVLVTAVVLGGLVQILVGVQSYHSGSSVGYVVFSSYGAFWLSLGMLFFLEAQGVFKLKPTDIACFFGCWFVFTIVLIPVIFRTSIAFSILHICLTVSIGCLVGYYSGGKGYMPYCIISSFVAIACGWYIMLSEMLFSLGMFKLPTGDLSTKSFGSKVSKSEKDRSYILANENRGPSVFRKMSTVKASPSFNPSNNNVTSQCYKPNSNSSVAPGNNSIHRGPDKINVSNVYHPGQNAPRGQHVNN